MVPIKSRTTLLDAKTCTASTIKTSGTGDGETADLVTITGSSKQFVRVGDAGNRITFNFCPNCGATVHYTIEGREEHIAIPIGAFAEPTFPWPNFSVYEERMHSWVRMPEEIEHMA